MPINNYLIIGLNPANSEMNVSLDKLISIKFAKAMDAATLTPANIVLKEVNGAIPTTYTGEYIPDIQTFRMKPTEPLLAGTQYEVHVAGGVDGIKTVITDEYLGFSRKYEFTTGYAAELSAPTKVTATQENGYPTVSWQQPANYDTSASLVYEVKVTSTSSSDTVPLWPAADDINQTKQLTLNVPKKFAEGYYFAHVRALNGSETSAWESKQFNVETAQTAPVTSPDAGGGMETYNMDVLDTYPRKDSVDITPEQIILVFSDNVDSTSVTDSSIYVVKKPGKQSLSIIDLMTDYSPAKKVALTAEPQVAGKTVTLTLSLQNDAEYTVIVSNEVTGMESGSLGMDYHWSFITKYSQLYGDPSLVRRDLGSLSDNISDKLLFSYLKEASDYAYQVVSGTTVFNETDYIDGNAPYYVHQYTRLRASYDLIMNSQMRSGGGGGMTTNIKLGDLSVEKDASTGGSVSGTLSGIRQEMKFYLDLMHGHNNRGYAKPSVVVRGENVEAYPDFLTRTEFRELGQ